MKQHRRLHVDSYNACKALDPTRPVNDASGYLHHITDVWTVHNYSQNPEELRGALTPNTERGVWRNIPEHESEYDGQPYLIDEYGGIKRRESVLPGHLTAASGNSIVRETHLI